MQTELSAEELEWIKKFPPCAQPGVNEIDEWDVRGLYEEKFHDAWNFNLSETTVSLITACAVSFSLILFNDIMFRVLVWARPGGTNHQAVLRYQVLQSFSNPINLFSAVVGRIRGNPSVRSRRTQRRPQNGHAELPKLTYGILIVMGAMIVCVEFLFILLATNQHKVYDVYLDAVPVFEFEDRGCDFIWFPAEVNACEKAALTEKAGFDLRASVETCFSLSEYPTTEGSAVLEQYQYELVLNVESDNEVRSRVIGMNFTSFQNARMGILLEQTGLVYGGMQNVRAEQLLSALLKRLERTNLTILESRTIEAVQQSEWIGESTMPFMMDRNRQNLTTVGASVVADVRNVDLLETHLSLSLTIADTEDSSDDHSMVMYLHDVMRSTMFPTGRGRGILASEKVKYLDEDSTPLAYYNRPWIGVGASLIICGCLLLLWALLAELRIEGGVDYPLEGTQLPNDTETDIT